MNHEPVVENNVISFPGLPMPPIEGMGATFYYKMLENNESIAQIDGLTGERETYKALHGKCKRAAIKMRAEGLEKGDIISICSLNNLNSCVPFIAGQFLGVVTAALDPSLSLQDTEHLLLKVRPKMIFVGLEGLELIEDALANTGIASKIVVFGQKEEYASFSEFLAPPSKEEEENFIPVDVNIKATAVIMFSSGTTGLPKGICLNHYGLLGSAHQTQFYTFPGDITVSFASMYWVSTVYLINYTILNNATRLICPKFDAVRIWSWIKTYRVNSAFLAPCQLLAMCHNGRPGWADTSSLRYLLTGGGGVAPEQTKMAQRCLPGIIIFNAYGQTEISGGGAIFRFTILEKHMQYLLEKPGSCGTGIPASTYKVVDPETEEALGPNKTGELRIKTNFQMNGYHNLDSSDCWDSEGFLKTGDVAYYDEDYCFYIVDRIKELLKYQSWHVAPAQIESVILAHPAVANAVVIGIPHPEDGDHPMALVVLKAKVGASVSAEDIRRFVNERVDDRKRLRAGVKIIENMLLTATGKINRRNIKHLVIQGQI